MCITSGVLIAIAKFATIRRYLRRTGFALFQIILWRPKRELVWLSRTKCWSKLRTYECIIFLIRKEHILKF